jgi:DNA polymerase-3 subunit epsilon/oligoribonuclease
MKIIFVDIETTGLNFTLHVPVEIALICIDSNNNNEMFRYENCIKVSIESWEKRDDEAIAFNGFNPSVVWKATDLERVKEDILELFIKHKIRKGDSFFLCQNPSFDRIMFDKIIDQNTFSLHNFPYHWLDLASMFWIKNQNSIKHRKNSIKAPLSKDNIAKNLGLKDEEKPHKALNGVLHLIKCYDVLKTK